MHDFAGSVEQVGERKNLRDVVSHFGAPSRENQDSDKNIIGQEMKFKMPVVNSSLVPLDASTRPNAVKLKLTMKKIKNRSRYDPNTVNEKIKSHPIQTTTRVNMSRNMRDRAWAVKYLKAVNGVTFNRFNTPFFRYLTTK